MIVADVTSKYSKVGVVAQALPSIWEMEAGLLSWGYPELCYWDLISTNGATASWVLLSASAKQHKVKDAIGRMCSQIMPSISLPPNIGTQTSNNPHPEHLSVVSSSCCCPVNEPNSSSSGLREGWSSRSISFPFLNPGKFLCSGWRRLRDSLYVHHASDLCFHAFVT